MSQFLFAVNCSWAQEFYSPTVLNVPCWLSQGLLQRLDPRAVWVYGLRCRGEAHQDMQKVFSSAVVGSACSAEVLALIFIRLNIFNRDLYKPKTSPHFLLSFQTDIESHSPARGFILSRVWNPTASSKPSVNVCSVWWSGTKRHNQMNSCIVSQSRGYLIFLLKW